MTDSRARWADRLNVPPDAPADAVAAAFLRALPPDFVPAGELVAAAGALTGAALPTGSDDAVEELLRDEVGAFAARFWSLAPGERLLAWDELSRCGADPVRLRELEPGLDVAVAPLADPDAEELAGLMRELFALAPRPRAIRRAAWLLERAAGMERWRAALAAVERNAPALAALETGMRAVLGPAFDPVTLAADTRRMSVSIDVDDFARRVRQAERPTFAEPEPSEARYDRRAKAGAGFLAGTPLWLLVVCCCLSGVLRQGWRNATDSPRPYTPAAPVPDARPAFWAFTASEVDSFEQYESDMDAGRPTAVPARYTAWVTAGRPGPVGSASDPSKVYFSDFQIAEFRRYDRDRTGSPPRGYSDWLQAGRPPRAGTHPLPKW